MRLMFLFILLNNRKVIKWLFLIKIPGVWLIFFRRTKLITTNAVSARKYIVFISSNEEQHCTDVFF